MTETQNIPEGYKKCFDCGKILPLTEEYFLKYWSKEDSKYYFKPHCRECGKIRCKQWRERNSEKQKAYQVEYAKSGKAKENARKYYAEHREKALETIHKYKATHREQLAEYQRARYANPETRDIMKASTKRWKDNNKEAVAEYRRQHQQANPEYYREKNRQRAALKRTLPNTLTDEEWEESKAEFDYCCAYCGKPIDRFYKDHFIPVSAGGGYTKDNIIPTCAWCNTSKHNYPFEEWYKKQPFYDPCRKEHVLTYLGKKG